MTVKTHNVSAGSELRIVGFEIEQRSIARGASLDSEAAPLQYLRYANGTIADGSKGMLFSYSIKTVNDDSTTWASRLDHYYAIGKYDVHMKQIIIALVIMLICSSLAIGYVRVSVTRDFALLAGGVSGSSIRGRSSDSEGRSLTGGLEIVSDATEHVGWQRLKDDVFRAPNDPTILAVLTGIGAQIALSIYIGLFLASIFYSVAGARELIRALVMVIFALCGYINGFMTSRTMKFFNLGSSWKHSALMTAMIFPSFILLTLSLGDIAEKLMGSSAAVPFSEGLLHYLVWWLLDAPCAAYGAYRGYTAPLALEPEVGQIKKDIPPMPFYLRRWAIIGIYGPLIFGTIFFEFEYIMDSIWRSYMIYGMFVILLVSLILMAVTIISLSICVTYQTLSKRNFDWWWNSFSLGASGGLYMFMYSMYYLVRSQDFTFFSGDFIYYITMMLISSCFGLMCASISVLASYLFIERIYNASSKGQFTKF